MSGVALVLISLLLIGLLIGVAILILRKIRQKRKAKLKEHSEPQPAIDSNKEAEQDKDTEETKKYCRSRCWCCLNCFDCQQRRPPGFDPFPKKPKRKYTITQQERERRRQRMKRRWKVGREEMIRKIRAGLWKWLLEIEDDCDCWCCKICLRCQTAKEYGNSGANRAREDTQKTPEAQIKSPKEQSKPYKKKTNSPKEGTKSPRAQTQPPRKEIKSSRRKIKSARGQNKPSQKRLKASNLSKRANKTRSSIPKALKNRLLFAKILEVIKKSGEAISKIFEKLRNWIGLGRQKAGRQIRVRKGQRMSKNRSLFIRIFRVVKKWIETISKFIERLPRQSGLSKQKGTQHNKSPPN